MTLRGLFVGVVALAFLEKVLSDQAAAGRVGGMLTAVGAVVQHLLDPTIPLVPDLRGDASTSGTQPGQQPPLPSSAIPKPAPAAPGGGGGKAVARP